MTLSDFQGHLPTASISTDTCASRGLSATAELIVQRRHTTDLVKKQLIAERTSSRCSAADLVNCSCKSHFNRLAYQACGRMTFRVSQGHREWHGLTCHIIWAYSNNVAILHRFHYHFYSVRVTACDMEKSFSFDATAEITRHVRLAICIKHIVTNACYIPEV